MNGLYQTENYFSSGESPNQPPPWTSSLEYPKLQLVYNTPRLTAQRKTDINQGNRQGKMNVVACEPTKVRQEYVLDSASGQLPSLWCIAVTA